MSNTPKNSHEFEGDLLDVVPDYREAIDEEQAIRSAAYLPMTESILGVDVLPMTPEHFVILSNSDCGFFRRRLITEIDVGLFLWALSPRYRPITNFWDRWQRRRFLQSVRKLNFDESKKAIFAYLEETFQDAPGTKEGKWNVPYWSFCASLIDLFAEEYGWTDERVMGAPLKRLYDLQKIITRRRNPNAIQFNPLSDAVRSKWLKMINEKNAVAN